MKSDFLQKLAQGRLPGGFALVDAALRHLPAFHGLIDALADKHLAIAVEQHDADARPVGQIGRRHEG